MYILKKGKCCDMTTRHRSCKKMLQLFRGEKFHESFLVQEIALNYQHDSKNFWIYEGELWSLTCEF